MIGKRSFSSFKTKHFGAFSLWTNLIHLRHDRINATVLYLFRTDLIFCVVRSTRLLHFMYKFQKKVKDFNKVENVCVFGLCEKCQRVFYNPFMDKLFGYSIHLLRSRASVELLSLAGMVFECETWSVGIVSSIHLCLMLYGATKILDKLYHYKIRLEQLISVANVVLVIGSIRREFLPTIG